ncbi:MAG: hypothetical protein M3322_04040, partial [Actinomycetota bacterium]|nr:hypothetical protein [Actinomycetota bacterium]
MWIRPAAPRNLDAILGARRRRPLPGRAAAVLVTRNGIRVLSRRPLRGPSPPAAETSSGPARPSGGSSTEP